MRGGCRKAAACAASAALLWTSAPAAAAPQPPGAHDTGQRAGQTSVRLLDGADDADGADGACTYPMKEQFTGRPWPLRRVLFDQLWEHTKGRTADGTPIRVAVIDTGVDDTNPQLAKAVDADSGADFLTTDETGDRTTGGPTADPVGHGTKVAGIIAARPQDGTGFVGLAPEAVIIPIRQNDAESSGTDTTLAKAIDHAVAADADIINVSQETTDRPEPDSPLPQAVRNALAQDIVVVASAGNDGADGRKRETYPAAYDGVLAVASSDRDNERVPFSQRGDFLGVAAPGVDIVSTVPGFGQCTDSGTSFSAPYASGVAALIRAEHPDWKQHQVVAQLEQTAERGIAGRDSDIGWGVVDPVRALTEDDHPLDEPVPDQGVQAGAPPEPMPLTLTETPQERTERHATYALGATVTLALAIAGAAVVARDHRRRRDTRLSGLR